MLVYAAAAHDLWAVSLQIVLSLMVCWDAGQELHIQYKADISACQP